MTYTYECCPRCGETNLDPRIITIGVPHYFALPEAHQDIITLKCQACGWLGEQPG